ncbi:MAG: flagellar biosynthesis anti-sigma factor FlgM [Bdellovibrionales bacterium GWC1_52_8]|nr:MAG: flagellar biosynthesis anti-sigma factor FlgM [Bdellovibrionales bacterium GWB1_52_6]OFZ04384.1 MAG: flagellar biosynthesis anti-sigma factor FlgM [Bdellovibrionales bacterium GWA1_52_35]OFZ38581.1 MAG: flagellar biosynthesis anti-sigma factor FlgM [Bdellovibrionales bacterium GWC1_52_8]
MRVSSTNSNAVQNAEVTGANKAAKTAAKDKKIKDSEPKTTIEGSVNAQLSAKGKEFARVKEVADSAPDIREAKIAELKSKIAAGKYNVNADALAERMVSEHLKMSGLE